MQAVSGLDHDVLTGTDLLTETVSQVCVLAQEPVWGCVMQ